MSAIISVTQNQNGSWTAKGHYAGVYAEITHMGRHEAVTALSNALYTFADTAEKAPDSLRKENQRVTPVRSKCLACGEYHEGFSGLPCPKMSPYSRVKP